MTTGWWIVVGVGVAIAIANLRTLGPLWASPGLERSQKIGQTVLLWIVPGSYLAVRQIVMTSGAPQPDDATRGGFISSIGFLTNADMIAARAHFDGGHQGHDAGGFDGGHHHGGGGHDGGSFDGGGGSDGGGADGGGADGGA